MRNLLSWLMCAGLMVGGVYGAGCCEKSDEAVARDYCEKELECDSAGFYSVFTDVDHCATFEAGRIDMFASEYGRGGAYRDLLTCMTGVSCADFNYGRANACPSEWDRVTAP